MLKLSAIEASIKQSKQILHFYMQWNIRHQFSHWCYTRQCTYTVGGISCLTFQPAMLYTKWNPFSG